VIAWKARDPIERVRRLLLERGGASAEQLDAVDAAVAGRIEAAIAWAAAQPEPPSEWAREDVFTDLQFAPLADWSVVDPGGSRAASAGTAR
jgi:TPP-dependent pyruvate/acetoin dehydrogenase alpha subunit